MSPPGTQRTLSPAAGGSAYCYAADKTSPPLQDPYWSYCCCVGVLIFLGADADSPRAVIQGAHP
jgi:hypothetical protein